jgi:hypothetical protein
MAKLARKDVRKKKAVSGKLANIDVLARDVADMLPTFPTKSPGSGGNFIITIIFFGMLGGSDGRNNPMGRTRPQRGRVNDDYNDGYGSGYGNSVCVCF